VGAVQPLKEGIFTTQASQQVGFGHLMECLAVAEKCSTFSRVSFLLIDSDERAAEFVTEKGYHLFPDLPIAFESTGANDWIFLNTRHNEYKLQDYLSQFTGNLVVLDELGNKKLKCHSLINFSINEEWHNYTYEGGKPRFYLGPRFYPLRDKIRIAHDTIQQEEGSVLVTLGGVDRSKMTLRLAEILGRRQDIACTYVIGPGSHLLHTDIENCIADALKQNVVVSPPNFDELLARNEFIISAGGNTIYEAAFLRKKILVIWEDDHEKIQGELFQNKGLARVIGGPEYVNEDLLVMILEQEEKYFKRAADEIVDGKGLERIAAILREF
jgi:spore coat polysaccharide biosynthesis predicted glycosyltransferase SpsG